MGEEFSIELKMILFRVIDFVEREREMRWLFLCKRQLYASWRCLVLMKPQLLASKRKLAEQQQEQKEKPDETGRWSSHQNAICCSSQQILSEAALIICCAHGYLFCYSICDTAAQNRKFGLSAVGAHRNGSEYDFRTTFTWFWLRSVIPRSSIYCWASPMSILIFPSNCKPRLGATWNV